VKVEKQASVGSLMDIGLGVASNHSPENHGISALVTAR
jgi:hypothetical protein